MVDKIKKMVGSKKKGFVSGIIVGMLVFSTLMLAYTTIVSGASPSIVYASPDNGDTFVDVWRGKGVNVTVNVSDGDGDLNQVVLKWNNSGTWDTFYDSGALGGVSHHNHTVLNSNFTGSWETYEYQICAYDTAWTNTTYSFTTGYVFGDANLVFGDFRASQNNMDLSVLYKNNTNDYYLWIGNASIDAERSSQGWDWITISKEDITSGSYPYNAFTYNGQPYVYYYEYYPPTSYPSSHKYLCYATWNGTSWVTGSTGIKEYDQYGDYRFAYGADAIYYNGNWVVVAGNAIDNSPYTRLDFYSSNDPTSPVYQSTLDSGYHYSPYADRYYTWYMPSTNILNGKLVLTYIDGGEDLHWQVYDGVSWTNKGDIEADLGTSSSEIQGHWQSAVKDPVNNQLVCVYINASGNMYYRTLTDPDGTWSYPYLIFQPVSGYEIKYPHASYIDHRLVVTFAYNIRGNYNIYMISAPDYMSEAHGVLHQYNRIQFPDATPNQQHVNSSVFYFKNIDSRAITEINTDLGTTDASGVLAPINSTTWATGMNWGSGEIRYFKLEILDVGAVPEDLHATDESIIWEITLE